MKVYCVTLDGVLYDIFRYHSPALKRCRELKGSVVETWEVEG
jgi:hypothetical protein